MPPVIIVGVYNERTSWALDEEYMDRIRDAAGDSFEVFQARSDSDVRSRLSDAEIILGFHLSPETLPLARNLKWVQATGAGIEYALTKEFIESPVILANASGIHAVQISEQAIGMMIALTRRFPHYIRMQAKKTWDRSMDGSDLSELFEKTLGIIGLGRIGEALAVRAKAFQMRVVGVKHSPLGYSGAADEVVSADAMERVFAESDYIVALLPMTPGTAGVISAQVLDTAKPGAYFLNFGRGGTVDEKALVKALASGRLAGAGLDVFAEEPLPKSSKLWRMDNVIITPHVSGVTDRYWERATELFCTNLSRYIAGEDLINVVDKELGY